MRQKTIPAFVGRRASPPVGPPGGVSLRHYRPPPPPPPPPTPHAWPLHGGGWIPGGGRGWPPGSGWLPFPLPLPPLPAFGFWFGPVGNDPLLLPLPLPPLPAFGFWFGPVGNDPFVLLPPPPRAMEPEIGASRATPTVATPSMMLSRFVIIVAPTGSLTSKGILRG
jgi:hypothetical protein